jgi:hypothetical protein
VTPPGPFRIDASGRVIDQVRVLTFRAVRKGLVGELSAALTTMAARVTDAPTSWGDPVSRLRRLDLILYRRVQGPVIIYYAVDETNRISYIRNVRPFPGRGLESVP